MQCKECGGLLTKKMKKCPSCGAKVGSTKLMGCLGVFVALVIIISIISSATSDRNRKKENERFAEAKQKAKQIQMETYGQEKARFAENAEKHYLDMKQLYMKHKYEEAMKILDQFKTYDAYKYKDVRNYDETIQKIIEAKRPTPTPKPTAKPARPTSTPRETVYNSPWGGGKVWQVKSWLKDNLKDPDSYEGIEWGKVIKQDSEYVVLHEYRAKNSLGGYVISKKLFRLDENGNVIKVSVWNR